MKKLVMFVSVMLVFAFLITAGCAIVNTNDMGAPAKQGSK